MEEITKIRSREEIPSEDKWAIEDLYPTDEAWAQELATLSADQEALTAFAGRLGESGQTLFDYLRCMEKFHAKSELLGNYCMRRADEDTRNPKYQAMQGKFMSTIVALGAATSFDTPQIMAISDETLESFYATCPKLERYRRYLTDLRRMKEHTLSEAEEKLLAAAGDQSAEVWNLLRGRAAMESGEYAQALEYLQKVEEVCPDTALPALERCCRELEDYKMAYHYACLQRDRKK